ncbi:MAG: hypothetical protein N3G80_02805 [Candidatus Micrarchaeota archaeon]|nr:hypothetical protein [Candidatus Micrarchaeota archaeon]
MKAQTSTEYLIILGVVLLIALGVIYLLGFFPSVSSDSTIAESWAYWGTAKPISIIDAKSFTGSACGQSGNGYVFIMSNNFPDVVRLTEIEIDNQSRVFCSFGSNRPNSVIYLESGKPTKVNVMGPPCPQDSMKEFSLAFTYGSGQLEGKRQSSTKKFALRCSKEGSGGTGNCAIGSCSYCQTLQSCGAAGCSWDGSRCFEPGDAECVYERCGSGEQCCNCNGYGCNIIACIRYNQDCNNYCQQHCMQ